MALALALSLTVGSRTAVPRSASARARRWHDRRRQRASGRCGGRRRHAGSRADFLQTVGQYGDRILFDLDSYSLDGEDRATLDGQAAWLGQHPNVRVTIEGHADERGTREYNLALGDRRANAARAYLESRGVSPGRMQVISWGKERPAVPESNESAWAQNRRSVTVVPE